MNKSIIQSIAVSIVNGLICMWFFKFSGINYNPGGVSGEPTTFNVTLSILYILIMLGVALIAGLLNLRGIIWGLFCTFIFLGIIILGTGSIIGIFILPFYFLGAPFTPIIEELSQLIISIDVKNPAYYVNGKLMIYIPIFFYLASILMFYMGRKIKAVKNKV